MIPIAGAFLTFLGFLFAGVLALGVTYVLDKSIGKEKALLLWSGVLLLFTLWQCTPDVVTPRASPARENMVPSDRLEPKGDPFAHPPLLGDAETRNPFQKHSDTRPLPPILLEDPPWAALPFSLPPTIPGPAPEARRLLRGEIPQATPGDGSTIPTIPDPVYADYTLTADDVYDAVVKAGRKTYVYINRIQADGTWYDEGDPRYDALKWVLARRGAGFENLRVEGALIGSAETAAKKLAPTEVLRARRENRTEVPASQFDEWILRSTVDNLYEQALRRQALSRDLDATQDITALRAAAAEMAAVGKTGKEGYEGWRRAAQILERALSIARERGVPGLRAEILEELVAAYSARKDEQAVLGALAEYARISPTRPEPWLWLGHLHLKRLGLPLEALAYYRAALDRAPRNLEARLGEGDALTALGRHDQALEAYRKGGAGYDAKVRVAEALLRKGDLSGAASALQAALADREGPRGLLAHGGVLYAQGDLEKARDAFVRAASAAGDEALEYRAQACYDLGLACWRLGQADAALAAFDACDRALRFGAAPSRFGDETVSHAFGRALVALSAGNMGELLAALQEAQEEAPQVAYHDYVSGVVASRDDNDATAVRAFARALRKAQVYPELDGWLARTRLNLARQALSAGTPAEEAARDFEAAVAFAARATETEQEVDRGAFRPALRECWVRIHADHVPARQRFERARQVVDRVLQKIDREQPGALTLRGYCNYRLAEFGPVDEVSESPYDPCIRDFQQVLNKVPADDQGEWRAWRDYAERTLAAIKHWRELEEKTVAFDGTSLPAGWEADESQGVRARVEDGEVRVQGNAKTDGTYLDPTVVVFSDDLTQVGQFEEIRVRVKIPTRDDRGSAVNTVTFGLEIQRKGGSSRTAGGLPPGAGLFYDRGKVAVRFAGGRDAAYKSGEMLRVTPEIDWPSDGWVELRLVRENAEEGTIALYLDSNLEDGLEGQKIAEDVVGTFKGTGRAAARVALMGWSTQAQDYDITVKEVRVVRRQQR